MRVMTETLDPRELALRIRLRAVRMVAPQGFGYLGQALSSAEQVAAVFGAARPGVDRIVCSPGHYIIGPFAAAAELGLADVSGYGQNGSVFEAIGTERSPVVDYTCGSLGQGLSAALGFALADRFRGSDARIFAMVSDGELEEGQVWEAALFAARPTCSASTGCRRRRWSRRSGLLLVVLARRLLCRWWLPRAVSTRRCDRWFFAVRAAGPRGRAWP